MLWGGGSCEYQTTKYCPNHNHSNPQVLSHLTDVRCTPLTGEDAGSFRLTFTFAENSYFSNKVRAGPAVLLES